MYRFISDAVIRTFCCVFQTLYITWPTVVDGICGPTAVSTLTFTAVSVDPLYNGQRVSIILSVASIEQPGWVVTPSNLTLAEGGAGANVTLQPLCKPYTDVTLTAIPLPFPQYKLSASSVTFPALSNSSVTVFVRAIDDSYAEGPMTVGFGMSAASADTSSDAPTWSGISVDIPVTIADNDVASLVLSRSTLSVVEAGASATASIVLTSIPYAGDLSIEPPSYASVSFAPFWSTGHCVSNDVSVPITLTSECNVDGDCDLNAFCWTDTKVDVSPVAFSFTPNNWNTPITVSVDAFVDGLVEGPDATTVVLPFTTVDPLYAQLASLSLSVSIQDVDVPGVVLTPPTGGSASVVEGGPPASFSARLLGMPHRPVTLSIASSDATRVYTEPASLFFDSASWDMDIPVLVSAVDDAIAELAFVSDPLSVGITYTQGMDPLYAALVGSSQGTIPVTVYDNDVAGVALQRVIDSRPVRCVGATASINATVCESTCTGSDGQITPYCPTRYCECVVVASNSTALTVGKSGVPDTVYVYPLTLLVSPVTVTLVSSTSSGVNTTVDPCTGVASNALVSWPDLVFDPPTITFLPGMDAPVAVTVSAFQNHMLSGPVVGAVNITVVSADPLYNLTNPTAAGQCSVVAPGTILPPGARAHVCV